jgi:hypothetical protein
MAIIEYVDNGLPSLQPARGADPKKEAAKLERKKQRLRDSEMVLQRTDIPMDGTPV